MNIITIVSDTLRYDCVAYHGTEPEGWDLASPIRTPHIDHFAQEAMVFDQAYTGSFPTIPMRTDMFTGKLTFPFRGWTPLPVEERILSEELSKAGYVSMLICDTPHLVRDGHRFDRGFSAWHWNRGQEGDRAITDDIPVEYTCDPDKLRAAERHKKCHLRWRTAHWQSEEDTFVARTMRDACRWLERNHTHEKFFLHIDTFDPHEPWDPPQHYRDLYDPGYTGQVVDHPLYDYDDYLTPEELRHCRALYAGEVTLVDTWLGRLFETMEHLRLYEDTAVFFLSDHGHYIGDHGRVGKSGEGADGPWPYYQEINHLVMMARVPGGKRGVRTDRLTQPVDIMPTILDLAGLPVPDGIDGISLVPLFEGKPVSQWPVVVTSRVLSDDAGDAVCSTITNGSWTLQYRGSDYPAELHDLEKDPHQEHNVYGDRGDEAERLHAAYVALLKEVGTEEAKIALRRELPTP
ncbi:MAG: sulfatase [Anaerolineae bacterium]